MKFQKPEGGEFKPVPAGMQSFVCTGLIDLGIQPGNVHQGKVFEPAHKIALIFQFPDHLTEGRDGQPGRPMTIIETFTASMGKKANLRKLIEGWFSKPFPSDEVAWEFDAKKLLNRAGLANIAHEPKGDKIRAKIVSLNPLPKGMPVPSAVGEPTVYEPDMDQAAKKAVYDRLPEWIQKKLNEQVPPKPKADKVSDDGAGADLPPSDEPEDDIPF
jgi:hypothetical protein